MRLRPEGRTHERRRAPRPRASRRPATRPGSGSSAARRCWSTPSRAASTSTRGSAGWCRRSPAGRTSRRWCRRSSAPAARPGVRLADLDAIAVTSGPGLAGALLVGVAAAKALARRPRQARSTASTTSPSHVAVDIVEHGPLPEPTLAMLVSGGHSSLLLVPDVTDDVRSLGATIDDAAGEAFDKVARVLGLPFPGGPHVDRDGARGQPVAIDFPRGLTSRPRHGAAPVRLLVLRAEDRGGPLGRGPRAVRRAGAGRRRRGVSFQEAVTDVLTRKAVLRLPRARGRGPADRRRCRGQLPAAGDGPGAVRRGRHPAAGAPPGPVHRQRRDGGRARRPDGAHGAARPPTSTCPPTPRCPSPPSAPEDTPRSAAGEPFLTLPELRSGFMSRSSDRLRSPGEGPRQARPTTPGDHHAEVPAPQALPRRPDAAPPLPPDGPVGSRGRGGAHGLPPARQRAAREERRVRRRAGAHAGAHLGALRRPGRRPGHHRRPAARDQRPRGGLVHDRRRVARARGRARGLRLLRARPGRGAAVRVDRRPRGHVGARPRTTDPA